MGDFAGFGDCAEEEEGVLGPEETVSSSFSTAIVISWAEKGRVRGRLCRICLSLRLETMFGSDMFIGQFLVESWESCVLTVMRRLSTFKLSVQWLINQ